MIVSSGMRDEFANQVAYVVDNPLLANLKDWPWKWSRGVAFEATSDAAFEPGQPAGAEGNQEHAEGRDWSPGRRPYAGDPRVAWKATLRGRKATANCPSTGYAH